MCSPFAHVCTCIFTCIYRKAFTFHKVGEGPLESGQAKPVRFTPPFKSTSNGSSSSTPKPSVTGGTSFSDTSRSLSDQTVRSRALTSSRLSLPQSVRPQQPSSFQAATNQHSRAVRSQADGLTPANPLERDDDSWESDEAFKPFGHSVQKSSPPIAFVAPVVSNSTLTRSVRWQRHVVHTLFCECVCVCVCV